MKVKMPMPAAIQVSAPEEPAAGTGTGRPVSSASTRPAGGLETTPLVFIGVGSSLAVVGTVPLVITLSLGVNSSATIIGVGFVGFGFLIIVPGLCWCLVANVYTQCSGSDGLIARQRRRRRHVRRLSAEQEVELLVFSDTAAFSAYNDATIPSSPIPAADPTIAHTASAASVADQQDIDTDTASASHSLPPNDVTVNLGNATQQSECGR